MLLANGGGRGGSRDDFLLILMIYPLALGRTALEGRRAWALLANGGSDGSRRRWIRAVFTFILIIFPLVVIILGHPVAHAKIVGGIAVDMLILGLVRRSKTARSALLNVAALDDCRLRTREVIGFGDETNLDVLVAWGIFEDVANPSLVLTADNGSSIWTVAPMLVPVAAVVGGECGLLFLSFFFSLDNRCCPCLNIRSTYPPTDLLGLSERSDARGIGKENSPGSDGMTSELALRVTENEFSRLREWITKSPWTVLALLSVDWRYM